MSSTTANVTSSSPAVVLTSEPLYAILLSVAAVVLPVVYVVTAKWFWMCACRPRRVDASTQRCCWDDGGVRGVEYHPAELKRLQAVGPCRHFLHHLLVTAPLMPTDDAFRALARHHRAACFCAALVTPLLSVTLLLRPLRYAGSADAARLRGGDYTDATTYEGNTLLLNALCGSLGAFAVGRCFWSLFASAPRGFSLVPRTAAEREAERTAVQRARNTRFAVVWALWAMWLAACPAVLLALGGLEINHSYIAMRHLLLCAATAVLALLVADPLFCVLLVCCVPRCCGCAKPAAQRLVHPGLFSWAMPDGGIASPLLAVQTEAGRGITVVPAAVDEDAADIKAGRARERNESDACDNDVAFDDELPEDATREQRAKYIREKMASMDTWAQLPPEDDREMSPVRVVKVSIPTRDEAPEVVSSSSAASRPNQQQHASAASASAKVSRPQKVSKDKLRVEQDIIDSFFGGDDDDSADKKKKARSGLSSSDEDDFLPPAAAKKKSSSPLSNPLLPPSPRTARGGGPRLGLDDDEEDDGSRQVVRVVSANPLTNVQQKQLRNTQVLDARVSSTLDKANAALQEATKYEQLAKMRKHMAELKRQKENQEGGGAVASRNGLLAAKGSYGGGGAALSEEDDLFVQALIEDSMDRSGQARDEDDDCEDEAPAARMPLHQQVGVLNSRGLASLLSQPAPKPGADNPHDVSRAGGLRISQRGAVQSKNDALSDMMPRHGGGDSLSPVVRRRVMSAAAGGPKLRTLDELGGMLDLPPSTAAQEPSGDGGVSLSMSPTRSSDGASLSPMRADENLLWLPPDAPSGGRNAFMPRMDGRNITMVKDPYELL